MAFVFVGLLDRIPREFVVATLGDGKGFRGIFRATIGQTIAFLVASPWNSFSLTIILIALTC